MYVAAYARQLETLLTEKIEALTKFRGEFCAILLPVDSY